MSLTSRFARRLGGLAAVAIVAAVAVPLGAAASPNGDGTFARSAAATGVVYGGQTAQGWPVMVELSKNHRQVVRIVVGMDMPCTSGFGYADYWWFRDVAVSKKRKFRGSFGPETRRHDDGTTSDHETSMRGAMNSAHSRVSGRWRAKVTFFDNAGAVIDTCSASVSWTAKQ